MKNLTLKEKMIAAYFTLSIFLLCVGDETPILYIAIAVLNFMNAARLIKRIDVEKIDKTDRV